MNVESDILTEVLGFNPETGEANSPPPPTTPKEIKSWKKYIANLEELSKWERDIYLPPSIQELKRRWRRLGLSESDLSEKLKSIIEERQKRRYDFKICETVIASATLDSFLDGFSECRMLIPSETCEAQNIDYTTRYIGIKSLLALAPLQEDKLVEIINRFNDVKCPAYGSSGTLQLVADYIVKPIIATSGKSMQEFMPRIS